MPIERGVHAQRKQKHKHDPRAYFLRTKTKTWVSEADKALGDYSNSREEFGTASGCYVSRFLTSETNTATTTLVCGFCSLETLKQVKETTRGEVCDERFMGICFATVNEARGVEFDNVVCVVDCFWDCFNVVMLEVGMNRCRDSLVLLVNTINGMSP